jgi:hypothetical protein
VTVTFDSLNPTEALITVTNNTVNGNTYLFSDGSTFGLSTNGTVSVVNGNIETILGAPSAMNKQS